MTERSMAIVIPLIVILTAMISLATFFDQKQITAIESIAPDKSTTIKTFGQQYPVVFENSTEVEITCQ